MRSIFWIAVLAVAIGLTIKIMTDLDIGKVIYNHAPGKCRYVEGVGKGSEDVILLSNGLALISSGFYMPITPQKQEPGKIYVYDPTKDASKAEPLTIKSGQEWKSEEFFPLGISVWEEKGETTIYVINSFTHQVYIFELRLKEKLLIHKRTVADESISNANNLVAVGRDQFYITNFVHYAHPVGFALEFSQKLPFGSVWFYDGAKFVRVLEGLKGPNGIAVSKSKRFLYLATHTEERLRVYRIEQSPAHTNLTLINSVDLYTGVDNVNVDHHGSVWIGAHPIAYKSVLHMLDSQKYPAPSQVLKIDFNADHSEWQLEEIFADDGSKLSGSATAALTPDGRKLLIGTVMHKMMICHIAQ